MSELFNRRENLFNKMPDDSLCILFAGAAKLCSEDAQYPFMSNRNFYYFTNIEQENSILVMIKSTFDKKTYLFIDEYDEVKEKWTGKRITNDQARRTSDIDDIRTTNTFESFLSLALGSSNNQFGKIKTVLIDLSPELKIKSSFSTENFKAFLEAEYSNVEVKDIYQSIVELRMVKSQIEIENIVSAIQGTNSGICDTIFRMKPYMYEYELSDNFEFYGRKNGFRELAFPTITAGGKNATCLHYPSQKCQISESELVLFDLGYKFNGYSADISRTYPINGKFEGKAKEIYEAVLECNKAVIKYVRAGMTIADLQKYTIEFLKEECIKRGLMSKDDDIKKYYYHNISHHLGLDTHDASLRDKPLENGNVITVEPGLYFANYGIGVRIEDDVLISEGFGECLSKDIFKEVSDIERLLSSKKN